MDKTIEVEMKLTLADQQLHKLLASKLIKDSTISGSIANQKLSSVYYDTKSYRFTKSGIVYRVRDNNGNYEATIKTAQSSNNGLSARREFNLPLHDSKPSLAGFHDLGLNLNLEKILDGESIEPLFTVNVDREVRLLQVTEHTVLEMAIDKGAIVVGDKQTTIDELELEIKEGTAEDLLNYVAALSGEVAVFAENMSKFARGLQLIGCLEKNKPTVQPLKIKQKSSVKMFLSKAVNYYSDLLFDTQNKLRKNELNILSADELLLPNFKKLVSLVNLQANMLLTKDCQKIENEINITCKYLEALRLNKYLQEQWQAILRSEANVLNYGEEMFEKINFDREKIIELIRQQISSGAFSNCIFRLIAWQEQNHVQDESLELEAIVAKSLKCRKRELKKLEVASETLVTELPKIRKIYQTLYYWRKMTVVDSFDKRTWKDLKKIYRAVRDLSNAKDSMHLLENYPKDDSYKLCYSYGILLGWSLQERPLLVAKVASLHERIINNI